MFKLLLSLVLSLLMFGGALADETRATESELPVTLLADSCAGCHGTDGKSPGSIPPLYGMSSSNIASAMRRYKNDQLRSTIMGRLAAAYSEAEIKAMADYFAAIK